MKRGQRQLLSVCEKRYRTEGLDIGMMIEALGTDKIGIFRDGQGEKVVLLRDKTWAAKWMEHYKVLNLHHRQKGSLEK
jgi:hypothetical protein